MIRLIILATTIFLYSRCSPAVYRTYTNENEEDANTCGLVLVKVRPSDSIVERLGEILVDDIGTSVICSESKTINYIKHEACSRGAQVVLIKQTKRPDDESYCYRCTAVLYKYKPGAKPLKPNNYFDVTKIKKREQRDRKKQINRTVKIVSKVRHIFHSILYAWP